MTDLPHLKQKTPQIAPVDGANRPALSFDANECLHFLDETDWTEAQKREFIEALWEIIVSFVDLAFGLNPVQQSAIAELPLEADSPSMVDSVGISKIKQEQDAGHWDMRAVQRIDS